MTIVTRISRLFKNSRKKFSLDCPFKQYGKYRLSAINNNGESITNRKYLLEFEAKFEKSLNTTKAWEESICEKSKVENLQGLSLKAWTKLFGFASWFDKYKPAYSGIYRRFIMVRSIPRLI
jgi:hypothetical protein